MESSFSNNQPTKQNSSGAQVQQRKIRVLVVDDEPMQREVMARMLAKLYPELSIQKASSGEEALESFRSERFDLVVTDNRMPGIRGPELIKTIKHLESSAGTKFLLVSASIVVDGLEKLAPQLGAALLPKPTNIVELRETVGNLLFEEPLAEPIIKE